MTPIFKDWGLFFCINLAAALESLIALYWIFDRLLPIEFSEWTVISVTITVIGAISQWGFKTPYMQMIVSEGSRIKQLQNLKSGILFLTLTGLAGGLLISLCMSVLISNDYWYSRDVIWIFPFLMACTNAQVLIITDLRINQKVYLLTVIMILRLPLYLLLIYFLLETNISGLLVIFFPQLCVSVLIVLALIYIVPLKGHKFIEIDFIKFSLNLGRPVMLALLVKYATEAFVIYFIRWGVTPQLAAEYAQVVKSLEIFNALFFLSFVMAWTPNFFRINQANTNNHKLHKMIVHRGIFFVMLGIPLAYLTFVLMSRSIAGLSGVNIYSLTIFMAISRMAAFAALSPSQYGFIISQRYSEVSFLCICELTVTIAAFCLVIYFDYESLVFIIAAALPWFTVFFTYKTSEKEAISI